MAYISLHEITDVAKKCRLKGYAGQFYDWLAFHRKR